ncbi:DNA-deoxyinosine glycosylase [Oleiphilus sp. HI0086]|uniref:DNA-deoxyinosine glycosylase n=1 Tax=Oleiphilus sp. HI0086 TaxID=1822260 RepID=UPI0007C2A6EC|nr:DNA-deoxyinosine glycosylase [Oleiphilus sp. HI0086]KZZ32099.1 hypothetical protein A3756_06085 [Oleiphilus sp. HI0086]
MAETQKVIDKGFPPVLGEEPTVLILGTMPSVKSLQEKQYYGHPRNAFWWILAQLCSFDLALPYVQRLEEAKRCGIAIWDVAHSCYRPGSLDSNIDQSTMKANDIQGMLEQNPSIKLIAFNGQAAAKLYKKFIGVSVTPDTTLNLPSTSPANAAMSKEDKLASWCAMKEFLNLDEDISE